MLKVSIIIPVYNGVKYIGDTVKRIAESTYSNLEILLINDGSKDNSEELCNELASKDSRIKVFTKENGGIYSARQKGLEVATGDYICFCDQDDFVEASMYEKLVEHSDNGNMDLVICGTYKLIDGNKVPYDIIPDKTISTKEEKNNLVKQIVFREFKGYISDDSMISVAIWKCMVKRDIIANHNIKFRRYISYEDDFLFLLDVLSYAEKIRLFPDQLYGWLVNLNSESHTVVKRYISDYVNKYHQKRDDIVNMLTRGGADEEMVYLYKQLAYCNMCNEYLQNEVGGLQGKVDVKLFTDNICEPGYQKLAEGGKYYRNVFFKKKIVMFLIRHKRVGTAIRLQKFYLKLKGNSQIIKLWSRFCK